MLEGKKGEIKRWNSSFSCRTESYAGKHAEARSGQDREMALARLIAYESRHAHTHTERFLLASLLDNITDTMRRIS